MLYTILIHNGCLLYGCVRKRERERGYLKRALYQPNYIMPLNRQKKSHNHESVKSNTFFCLLSLTSLRFRLFSNTSFGCTCEEKLQNKHQRLKINKQGQKNVDSASVLLPCQQCLTFLHSNSCDVTAFVYVYILKLRFLYLNFTSH